MKWLGREQDFKSYNGGIDLDAVEAAHAAGGRRWAYSEEACSAAPVFDDGWTRASTSQSVVVTVPRREASSSPALAKSASVSLGEPGRGTYASSAAFAK